MICLGNGSEGMEDVGCERVVSLEPSRGWAGCSGCTVGGMTGRWGQVTRGQVSLRGSWGRMLCWLRNLPHPCGPCTPTNNGGHT